MYTIYHHKIDYYINMIIFIRLILVLPTGNKLNYHNTISTIFKLLLSQFRFQLW